MFSSPILRLNMAKIRSIKPVNQNFLKVFSIFIIIIFGYSVIDIVNNLNMLIINLVSESTSANEIYLDSRGATNSVGINFMKVLAAAARDYPQFLLFYSLTLVKKNKLIITGLVVAILVSLLSGLVNGLRGNVVFVVLSSVFCYMFFSKFYSTKVKMRIRLFGIVFFLLVAIPFVIISTGRFDTGFSSYKDSGFASKMYIGQSMLYFNNHGLDNNGIRYGDRTIPVFKGFVFDGVPKNSDEIRLKYNGLSINEEVFSTFVGEFTTDFTGTVTFFIFFILFLVSTVNLRLTKDVYLHQVLVLYFIWNVLTYGIFLFPYAGISGNLRIVNFIIIISYLKLSSKKMTF
jgi:oligosaccharide repeat unit polymerase